MQKFVKQDERICSIFIFFFCLLKIARATSIRSRSLNQFGFDFSPLYFSFWPNVAVRSCRKIKTWIEQIGLENSLEIGSNSHVVDFGVRWPTRKQDYRKEQWQVYWARRRIWFASIASTAPFRAKHWSHPFFCFTLSSAPRLERQRRSVQRTWPNDQMVWPF